MPKKRPSLTDLTSGKNPLARHIATKGESVTSPKAPPATSSKPRYMQIRLTDNDLKLMRVMAAQTDRSLQRIALDALNEYRKREGFPEPLSGFGDPADDAEEK